MKYSIFLFNTSFTSESQQLQLNTISSSQHEHRWILLLITKVIYIAISVQSSTRQISAENFAWRLKVRKEKLQAEKVLISGATITFITWLVVSRQGYWLGLGSGLG